MSNACGPNLRVLIGGMFKNLSLILLLLHVDFLSYWNLPAFDSCWNSVEDPLLAPIVPLLTDNLQLMGPLVAENLELDEKCIAEVVTIRTPLDLESNPTPCPVNPENTDNWTAIERQRSAAGDVVSSIPDMREKVRHLYI